MSLPWASGHYCRWASRYKAVVGGWYTLPISYHLFPGLDMYKVLGVNYESECVLEIMVAGTYRPIQEGLE